MATIDVGTIVERFRESGIELMPKTFNFKIEDARNKFWRLLQYYTNSDNPTWIPEYNKVCEYLADNKGKGLFLYGSCGRGKTLITKKIIPTLIYSDVIENGYRLSVKPINATQMADMLPELKRVRLLTIDDVGTESAIHNEYGNKSCPLEELIDNAEQNGNWIMMSSNINVGAYKLTSDGQKDFTQNTFVKRYGQRTLDRLKSCFCCIAFNGESLRGK